MTKLPPNAEPDDPDAATVVGPGGPAGIEKDPTAPAHRFPLHDFEGSDTDLKTERWASSATSLLLEDPSVRALVGFGHTLPVPSDEGVFPKTVKVTDLMTSRPKTMIEKEPPKKKAEDDAKKNALPNPGDLVADRYRVIRTLGEGGMGIVYEVSHVRLGKFFALKLLLPSAVDNKDVRNSFFREAKYASSLQHQNLVAVLDFGEAPDFGAYMLMELAHGRLLSSLLSERGKFSIQASCETILQVADVLAYIHKQNLVHCDLKPQNIIMVPREDTSDGYAVKLLDFGLAQSRVRQKSEQLFGTPQYMSPELSLQERPTPAADIYSLGILLFQLVTGDVPWTGTVASILRAHRSEEPPSLASRRGEDVAPGLEALVSRALSKNPEDRHNNMAEFVAELREVMHIGHPRSPQAGPQDPRVELMKSAFAATHLPLAAIDFQGKILVANASFSQFVLGIRSGVEGTNLHATSLAQGWATLDADLQAACSGQAVARLIEIANGENEQTNLQMWLEPMSTHGYAVLSVYSQRR